MIDQVRERPDWLKGSYKYFELFMKLTPEDHNLEIKVENLVTAEQYRLTIDRNYIAAETQFKHIFEEPFDILNCFIHHFKDVTIEEGLLSIRYEFTTNRQIAKSFSFKLAKVEVCPLELAHSKMEQMKVLFEAELGQKQKRIVELEATIIEDGEKHLRALQASTQKNRDLEQKIEALNEENRRLKNSVQQLNQREKIQVIKVQSPNKPLPIYYPNFLNPLPFSLPKVTWKTIEYIEPEDKNFNISAKIRFIKNFGKNVFLGLGDKSGMVNAFVPNNEFIIKGNTITLKNVKAVLHNGNIQLQLMGDGKIQLANFNMPYINQNNNISDVLHF